MPCSRLCYPMRYPVAQALTKRLILHTVFKKIHHSVWKVSSMILRRPNSSATAICGGSRLAASTSPSSKARAEAAGIDGLDVLKG